MKVETIYALNIDCDKDEAAVLYVALRGFDDRLINVPDDETAARLGICPGIYRVRSVTNWILPYDGSTPSRVELLLQYPEEWSPCEAVFSLDDILKQENDAFEAWMAGVRDMPCSSSESSGEALADDAVW